MRIRTRDLAGLQVRTLNAIALAIVNGVAPFAPQPRRFATIDEPEVRRIIGSLVTFPRRRNTDPVAPWIEALGLARLGLVDPEVVERRYDGDVDGFASMFPRYRLALDRPGRSTSTSRSSAPSTCCSPTRSPVVLRSGPAECCWSTSSRISRPPTSSSFGCSPGAELVVFGVGDDDQTIYGYNGADPAWLIDFVGLFPGAGDHPLEVNYRCPDGIVDAADRLLRHNRRRVPKTIRGVRPGVDRLDGRPRRAQRPADGRYRHVGARYRCAPVRCGRAHPGQLHARPGTDRVGGGRCSPTNRHRARVRRSHRGARRAVLASAGYGERAVAQRRPCRGAAAPVTPAASQRCVLGRRADRRSRATTTGRSIAERTGRRAGRVVHRRHRADERVREPWRHHRGAPPRAPRSRRPGRRRGHARPTAARHEPSGTERRSRRGAPTRRAAARSGDCSRAG